MPTGVALVIAIVVCLSAGALGGWFTSWSVGTWYQDLAKPAWTPPGAVFGPVWTTLYALMGCAAWLVWRGRPSSPWPLRLFGVQLALNVAWSALFFGLRAPGWALVDIVLLLAAIVATMWSFRQWSRLAAGLLAPYLVWVAFATALNFAVWHLN